MQAARGLLALFFVLAATPLAMSSGPDDPGCVNLAYSAAGEGFWLYPSLGDAIGLMITEGVGNGASVGVVVFPSLCDTPPIEAPLGPATAFAQGALGQRAGTSFPEAPPVLPLP